MRSFARAAKNLALTPSTVSARIRQLERAAGRPLLKRNSRRVQLTAAGERLLRHAMGILEAWEQARRDLAVDELRQIAVAGVASFWDIFLQQWLNRVRTNLLDVAPWVEVSTAARVTEKLAQGSIQLGFLYSPPRLADLVLRELEPVELALVSSQPGQQVEQAFAQGYVLVDWGTLFTGAHDREYAKRPAAAAHSNSGRVALEMIHTCGGSAYLPRTLVDADIARGRLFPVEAAAVFEMRVYAAYAAHGEQGEIVERMLDWL